ncbi:MAG: PEP-CTERM sorting domain-containing protein [Planctomycetota bacterium]
MKQTLLPTTLIALATFTVPSFAASFTDTFDAIDPAWTTDRYEPAGFSSVFFDGDNRLEIAIDDADSATNRPASFSSGFYDTQGRKRVSGLEEIWTVSGELYVSSDMVSGNNLRRTDLWARDGDGSEPNAEYPIFGMRRFDPSDPFNASASNISSVWRVWDPDTGGWVELIDPVTEGWHTLSITGTGSSFVYELNGTTVYTDNTVVPEADLTEVFVQAFNFGGGDYSVYWDNISVVPEPASLTLLGVAGLGLMVRRRRRA